MYFPSFFVLLYLPLLSVSVFHLISFFTCYFHLFFYYFSFFFDRLPFFFYLRSSLRSSVSSSIPISLSPFSITITPSYSPLCPQYRLLYLLCQLFSYLPPQSSRQSCSLISLLSRLLSTSTFNIHSLSLSCITWYRMIARACLVLTRLLRIY